MTKPSEQTPTVLFFAYGTLRKGEALHEGWLGGNIIEDLGVAEMPGARLFFARGHRGFPYLRMTGKHHDRAVGEVFRVPLNSDILAMFQMEVNAGYRILDAEALLNGEVVEVVVCVLDQSEAYRCGDPVPNNDWSSLSNEGVWS